MFFIPLTSNLMTSCILLRQQPQTFSSQHVKTRSWLFFAILDIGLLCWKGKCQLFCICKGLRQVITGHIFRFNHVLKSDNCLFTLHLSHLTSKTLAEVCRPKSSSTKPSPLTLMQLC